jgi:hypothetical protein
VEVEVSAQIFQARKQVTLTPLNKEAGLKLMTFTLTDMGFQQQFTIQIYMRLGNVRSLFCRRYVDAGASNRKNHIAFLCRMRYRFCNNSSNRVSAW